MAVTLARLEAEYGPPLAALEYASQAIRTYHDSGNTSMMGTPLVVLATFSTGSDATNRRPPSPVSQLNPFTGRSFPSSTPRSPTYATSSATRPTNRSPARVRR